MRCRIDLHGELEIMASCNYEEADPPDRRHPRARQLPRHEGRHQEAQEPYARRLLRGALGGRAASASGRMREGEQSLHRARSFGEAEIRPRRTKSRWRTRKWR